ncbi:MAG TPA: SAM-dependent methyltransferase [Mycobacterium sp.]|nr:SAM-dependent methyltransferase [Mycobacterium sp.]
MAIRRLDHRASWTAQVCAAQRAAETMQSPGRRLLDDPYAHHFVAHPALRGALLHRLTARAFIGVLNRNSPGVHDFVALRVRYIDELIRTATQHGIEQIALLGAGFDTTSLRIAASPVTVFEIDTPATQKDKRLVAEPLLPGASRAKVVWVPCDFEHDSLSDRLLGSGFDPSQPSVITWIGVTMFLTPQAIAATFADLSALCAPGSQLAFDYIDANVVTGDSRSRGARRVARTVARRGEPYRTGFAAPEVEALVADYGFTCREHARTSALLRRYAPEQAHTATDNDWLAVATAQRI